MGLSGETALVIRVELPTELEDIRRRFIPEASAGLPAHVTLLYPFAAAETLDSGTEARIAKIAASHFQFAYRLAGPCRWPNIAYASVIPDAPFIALQADLASAFPEYPLFGGVYDFVPHVTVADVPGPSSALIDALIEDPAWTALLSGAPAPADSVELIVRTEDKWSLSSTFPLGSASDLAADGFVAQRRPGRR